MSDELINEIKSLIIESLKLEDIALSDIDEHEPLFIEGLGLDSIDALELGIALQKHYGLTLEAEEKIGRSHFANVISLANYVAAHRTK